jgi:tRNA threonylcarbamoyladenosine biosynthesis protein TsaB
MPLEKPLIAINTLQLMCVGLVRKINAGEIFIENSDTAVLVPMIDARRMEVYSALFTIDGEKIRDVEAEIINESSFAELLKEKQILCFGDGAKKAKDVIKHPNFIFVSDIYPSAQDMAELAEKAYTNKKFEDTAYFEPFYLKDFVATIPKKNIFS